MDITLSSQRSNDDDITVYFTLTDGADAFKWHADIPLATADIQAYLEANIDTLRCGIYRKQYREAQVIKLEGETDLQAWRRWEAEGCKNTTTEIVDGKEATVETVIEKKAWKDTH